MGGLSLFILFYLFCLAIGRVVLAIGTGMVIGFRVALNPKVTTSPKIVQSQRTVTINSKFQYLKEVIDNTKFCCLKDFSKRKLYLVPAPKGPT
jgi:hypothetical protein